MGHVLGQWSLDRYFTRGLEPRTERAMRGHLGACGRCRDRYQRHLLAESLLPARERLTEDRLWRSIRAAGVPARARWGWVSLLALGAAAASLLLVPRLHTRVPVARGTGVAVAPGAHLHLYRVAAPGRAEAAGGRIAAADALVLAYSNPGPVYDRLMVFAVDQSYRVHWFYPAFQRAGDDPEAITIARQRAGVELGEAISHPFLPGPLRVYALFLDRPLRVSRVEALVAETLARPGLSIASETLLPVPGAHQETQLLEVTP